MGRLLFVVARSAQERYDFLRYAFAGDDHVEVVFDRRRQPRRRQDIVPAMERRRKERRVHDITPDLSRQGYAVVRWP